MSDWLVLPEYGRSTLAEILPAMAAHLVPGLAGTNDPFGLPAARRYVLAMIDGLGLELLRTHRARVPYLAGLVDRAHELTSAVPSTTATSLTCLGTGIPPGRHGIVGYSFRAHDWILNALLWDDRLVAEEFQPTPTWFQRLNDRQVATTAVTLAQFEGSGLTRAGLRGPRFVGLADEQDAADRIARIVQASRAGMSSLVYAYDRRLDHTGHGLGCGSTAWLDTLDRMDDWLERLRAELDPEVCLLITGDHGMVDVPNDRQIILEDTPGLANGLELIGGEGRLRQLYTARPDEVAAQWRRRLGDRALVVRREEALEAGWFGPVAEEFRPRIGDVLVAMADDWAVMTLTKQGELTLVGQHGSLTSAEMRVPLLVDAGR